MDYFSGFCLGISFGFFIATWLKRKESQFEYRRGYDEGLWWGENKQGGNIKQAGEQLQQTIKELADSLGNKRGVGSTTKH